MNAPHSSTGQLRLWRWRFTFLLAICAASALSAAEPNLTRYEKEVLAYEAADRARPPATGGILFTGASGIRLWKTLAEDFSGLPVLNRGFGGSTTAELIHYTDRLIVPHRPRVIALQPGSNDLVSGLTPEQTLADFERFVAKVRAALPDARIVYLGINPSPARWDIREQQQRANALIRAFCQHGKNLAFVDLWDASLGKDGLPRADYYVKDRLHPSRLAYAERVAIIRPFIE